MKTVARFSYLFILLSVLSIRLSECLYRSKDVFSCFVLHSNEFLEKSGNVLIENIDDVNECLRKCIQAPLNHKLKCKTVMYNVNTKNCVLSKYTREERKVKKSKGLQIDLYENKCASESETVRLAVFTEQVRTTASPVTIVKMPSTIITSTSIPTTNELRRLHAVKQFPLDPKRESVIFSKTVFADPPTHPEQLNFVAAPAPTFAPLTTPPTITQPPQQQQQSQITAPPPSQQQFGSRLRNRNAKTFVSARPVVDSTSTISVTQQYDQIQQRRQRSGDQRFVENLGPCFIKSQNRVLAKFEESKTMGLTLEGCIRVCAHTTNFYCASINYSSNQRTCILNGGNVHLNGEALLNSRDYDYYENICQPKGTTTEASTGQSTRKECYRLYNNSIYNSFDATIVGGLNDLESCESECSWSHVRRREKCIAVNWVSSTRGCMLFHKPIEYSLLQPSFKSIFLVNTCTQITTNELITPNKSRSKSTDPDYYDN